MAEDFVLRLIFIVNNALVKNFTMLELRIISQGILEPGMQPSVFSQQMEEDQE